MTSSATRPAADRPYIPDGYAAVTPYIGVRGARSVLDFVTAVFGATVVRIEEGEDGTLGHTEFEIDGSLMMLTDTGAEWPETPGAFYVYVEDPDAAYRRALDAGGRSIMEPADRPYGDRNAGVYDGCGNQWWMATPVRSAS